jgi:ribosome-binding protein aMBF1 (putative translation factor)
MDLRRLNVELARLGLRRLDLARKLRVPRTTLSTWLTRASTPPSDLGRRIEKALKLPDGTL